MHIIFFQLVLNYNVGCGCLDEGKGFHSKAVKDCWTIFLLSHRKSCTKLSRPRRPNALIKKNFGYDFLLMIAMLK